MDGRKVHRVPNDAVAQEIANRRRRLGADQLLRFLGRRRDVRRGDDLRKLRERPVRRRLRFEHVQRGRAHDAACNRAAQRRFVDQLAARGVDEANAGPALREPLVVEEMLRLGRRGQVQRQVVGRRAHLLERHQLDAERGRDLLGDERVVRDDPHAERAGALRDLLSDPPEAGDAERLPAQLAPEKLLLLPPGVLHRAVGRRHRSRQCEHQCARMFGDADAVRARRVHDENAACAGGSDVDVVDAGAGATDDAEVGGSRQQVGIDGRRAAHEERVSVCEVGGEYVGFASGSRVDDPAGLGAEQFDRGGRQIVGNDDFQREVPLLGPRLRT